MSRSKKNLAERFIERSFRDYQGFTDLPLRQRLQGAGAIVAFNTAVLFALHLALKPLSDDAHLSTSSVWYIYTLALIGNGYVAASIVNSRLRKPRYYLTYICLCAVFGALYGFFTGRGFAHITIGMNGIEGFHDVVSTLLFFGIVVCVYTGMRLYGNVMSTISREKVQMVSELDAARIIQQRFVPEISLNEPFYTAFGKTVPSNEVGGDYFDVVRFSEHEIAVAVGDVSGHNIAAGLLMAVTKSAFRTELKHYSNLPALMQSLNQMICENADKGMFVSFQCCLVNFQNQTLIVANAGHLPVLHYTPRTASVQEIKPRGMALGLATKGVFNVQSTSFQEGDVFVFLTDGVMEATNAGNEEFGLENVKRVLKKHGSSQMPQQLYDTIISHLRTFCGAGRATLELADDATLLAINVKSQT